ncbi:MAG TPA: triose-phosphate isomerase, partial [bacterium]|nr:triose-phosphate isomerase [bacterium]
SFFGAIGDLCRGLNDREVVVTPSFPYIAPAAALAKGRGITIAAQDFHPEENGAFTGEVSLAMLADLGVRTVLIGHSERRHVMGETHEHIRKKVAFAQKKGFRIIFCIGETLAQRQKGELFAVIDHQLSTAFDDNLTCLPGDMVIAYEPVWAIGTGVNATGAQAQEMHDYIRHFMDKHYGRKEISILYGGSVKPDNVKELMMMPDIDGALVGGASLKAESFSKLIFWDK